MGPRLRVARLNKGLNLEQAAEGICSVSYLSLTETGQRLPNSRILRALAARLDLALGDVEIAPALDPRYRQALVALKVGDLKRCLQLIGDMQDLPEKWLMQGLVELETGDPIQAYRLLKAAKENRVTDAEVRLRATIGLLYALRYLGDLKQAIDIGEQAIEEDLIRTKPVDSDLTFELRAVVASIYNSVGSFAEALSIVERSENDEATTVWQQVMSHWVKSTTFEGAGDLVHAEAEAKLALSLIEQLDRPRAKASLLNIASRLQLRLDRYDPEEVRRNLNAAEQIVREIGGDVHLAQSLDAQALAEAKFGNTSKAAELLQQMIGAIRDEKEAARAEYLISAAYTQVVMKDLDAARASLAAAQDLLTGKQARREQAIIWRQMSKIHEMIGDASAALECLKKATDLIGLSDTTVI